MSLVVIPRESVEAYPFTFALSGTPLTSGVNWALVPTGSRPSAFQAAVTWNGNYPCFTVNGSLAPGRYRLYANTTTSSYTPERYVVDVIIE